tara:strand:- start:561 stop:1715 length:1155 start_codon:yes stop_codon:yes gene_type:complete
MSKYPSTWKNSPLGVVVEVINGRAYKFSEWEKSGTPVIRLQNLTQGGGRFYYSKLNLPKKQYCKKGDLLFMWSASFGPYIWWGDKAIFHYHIWKMLPKDGFIDKKYLYYQLLEKTESWRAKGSGSTMTHLTKSEIESETLNIPPLPEQKKIAKILSEIERNIELTKKKIHKLDLLIRGLFYKEFSKSDLEEFVLGDLCLVTDGAHNTPTYSDQGIPFLRVTDIKSDFIDMDSCKKIPLEEHTELCRRCNPQKGDILLSKNGTIGICRLIDWDWDFSLFVSLALIKIKDKDVLSSKFLEVIFSSPNVINQMFATSKQGTVSNLHLEEIRKFKIPLPSMIKQKKIVEIFSSIKKYQSTLKKSLQQLDLLKNSVSIDLISGLKRVKV